MAITNPSGFRNEYGRDKVRKKRFYTSLSQPFLEQMNEAIEGKHRSALLETSARLMLVCLDDEFDEEAAKYIAKKIKSATGNDAKKIRQFVTYMTMFTNILVKEASKKEKKISIEDLLSEPW